MRLRYFPWVLLIVAAAAAGDATPAMPGPFNIEQRKATQWAWRAIRPQEPPVVKNTGWAKTPIDHFILAKLEAKGLAPAPVADRRTLIRRAYFDLIGTPPPAAAIDAFLKDESADAFAKVVDGLLASPHFGERWARHWMDLARYAESYGHEFDFPIANAWRYRDYLIRAFNADVPYDQFVTEQIAGDLLPNPRRNPIDGTDESILGAGFWWFGEQEQAPVDLRQHQADRIDNQIDVFGTTFLGLTLHCARCHDHKFDPIAQKDYYSMFGILESSCRQDAFLDPHQTITKLNRQMKSLADQGNAALIEGLPQSDAAFRAQFIQHLLDAKSHDPKAATALAEAARDPSNPFFAWTALASATPGDFDARRRHALEEIDARQKQADDTAGQSTLYRSFSDGYHGWFSTGWSFGAGPSADGQWDLTRKGVRVAAPGLAFGGMLSGRLHGVLRSPSFTLKRPQILYRVAGNGGRIHLVIDGFRIDEFDALLFNGTFVNCNTDGKFVWRRQAQDVSHYVGQTAHIEILDEGKGWMAVDQIRFADAASPLPVDPPSAIARAILQDPKVISPRTLFDAYAARLSDAISARRGSSSHAAGAQLLAWAINHDLVKIAPAAQSTLDALRQQIDALDQKVPQPELAVAMAEGTPDEEHVFLRGSHKTPGPLAPRGFLEAIDGTTQPPIGPGSGRLELARRMVDPSDPFLSRVMVNRVWHHLFGRGIVASPDNFGLMGTPPSHPQLLDYLATQFMRDGWSVKKTIRSIMLTQTYRMSSLPADAKAEEIDPENILLHRANIRRLEAEPIRDSILTVSGRLDPTIGGPSVSVYLTPFMEGRGRPGGGPLDGAGRRSIYLAERRNFLSPMMLAFDMPIPFSSMGRRNVSNVPAQALILMNDPFVIDQAKLWAKRVLEIPNLTPRQRVDVMYVAAFSRPASDGEWAKISAFMDRHGQELGIPAEKRFVDPGLWASLGHALFNTKEFIFLN